MPKQKGGPLDAYRDTAHLEALETERMRLVPATAAIVRLDLSDRLQFGKALGATIPDEWPPEMLSDALDWFADQMDEDPSREGWLVWYGLLKEPDRMVLAASAGFLGKPHNGVAEVGYSVLPSYQRMGLATEMVRALIDWAVRQPGVSEVVAEVDQTNMPSLRLLSRLGFRQIGPGRDPGHLRFRLVE